MIEFKKVTKRIWFQGRAEEVLSQVSVEIPAGRRIALLASSAHDKATFIRLLAGLAWPTSGRITRHARISFPVGYLGGFSGELSARANVAHAAQLYGAHETDVVSFVERMSELGSWFDKRFRDLPGPMKVRLAVTVAFAIPFDMYLLNRELVRPKDDPAGFTKKVVAMFEARARTSGMIIATGNKQFARKYCDMGLVLHRGQVVLFDEFDKAISISDKLAVEERNSWSLRY